MPRPKKSKVKVMPNDIMPDEALLTVKVSTSGAGGSGKVYQDGIVIADNNLTLNQQFNLILERIDDIKIDIDILNARVKTIINAILIAALGGLLILGYHIFLGLYIIPKG